MNARFPPINVYTNRIDWEIFTFIYMHSKANLSNYIPFQKKIEEQERIIT
jgi:hypothetical protein